MNEAANSRPGRISGVNGIKGLVPLFALALLLLLAACSESPTPTPRPSPTSTPAPIPTATPPTRATTVVVQGCGDRGRMFPDSISASVRWRRLDPDRAGPGRLRQQETCPWEAFPPVRP